MIEKKTQFSFIRFPLKLLHLHNQILEFMQIFPNKGRMGLVSKQSFLTNQREKMVQKTNNGNHKNVIPDFVLNTKVCCLQDVHCYIYLWFLSYF
jgi:hypothetical protein